MLREQDFEALSDLLDDVWSLKGSALLTAGQKAMWFRALGDFTIADVRKGLHLHLRDTKHGTFLPMPADVIRQIDGLSADDGRPGVEEAWAMAFRAADESATVVWTDEMSEAFKVARPLLVDARDEVGARMAFKEAYARLLAQARERRVPVQWTSSLGFDAQARDAELLPHVEAGRISRDLLCGPAMTFDTLLALPAPAAPQKCLGGPVSGLSGALPADANDEPSAARAIAMQRLAELRAEIASRADRPSTKAEAERRRTEALKARAKAKVDEYLNPNTEGANP